MNIGILSVDYYLPTTRVQTSELMDEIKPERFGATNQFIEENTGIKEVRHIHNELPSEMAIAASNKAIHKLGINPSKIDVIIFCGIDRDYNEPATAHAVQAAIGSNGFCFDVQNACLGFASGLIQAEMWIRSGRARYALVCTGERSSLITKDQIEVLQKTNDLTVFKNRIGGLMIGDAGAAAIIGPTESSAGFKNFNFYSNGKHTGLCYYKIENGKCTGEMLMGKITAATLKAHQQLYPQSLADVGWQPKQIDRVIAHQVGHKPWIRLAEILDMKLDRFTKTFENFGNLTSATFPINLAIGLEEKKILPGMKIFGALSGSGLSIVQMGMEI